ncbi:shikimate kinase AroK [Solimonas terrae]|uniref:Shikimate kinase n=1 Tax=Solimonas terrae TaxID=1396819 RepID=A0A6M2BV14_9GAMM|nr:shikimate kinase AroK [Solimonas terrae]NGY06502.1 shikimate kinase AroK [Solimonas terrae]
MTGGCNIFLIGPMGAGKTTVGRRLAELRGLEFIDSDHEIEARTGVDIPYIFEREGEAGFRKRESQMISELVMRGGIVLATGGGAVLDADNRRVLAAHGYVVYLHASVDQQLHRTSRADNRPLLHNVSDRRGVLSSLFAQRDPLYREIADLIVSTDGRSAKTLVHEIEQGLDGSAPPI